MTNEPKKIKSALCTHTAWFLMCPVYLSGMDEDSLMPIPRKMPWWWFDFNLWINDWVCWLLSFTHPEAVGYVFYHVHEMQPPTVIIYE